MSVVLQQCGSTATPPSPPGPQDAAARDLQEADQHANELLPPERTAARREHGRMGGGAKGAALRGHFLAFVVVQGGPSGTGFLPP